MKHFVTFLALFLTIELKVYGSDFDSIPAATVGYEIVELASGNTVSSFNATKTFIPASTLKSVTAAAALLALGAEYTFDTRLDASGEILGDTLHGDLIIRPSGDPSLDATLCDEVKTHGIGHIVGNVSIKASTPWISPSWMIEDVGTQYGVGWSTFNYRHNEALVNDEMESIGSSALCSDFIFDLRSAGVKTCTNHTIEHPISINLFTHHSKPLSSLLRHTLHESDNLYAEAIGRTLATNPTNGSAAIDSIKLVLSTLGVPVDDLHMVDCSGLSRFNLVTPSMMTRLMVAMSNSGEFLSLLPLSGRDGTLHSMLHGTRLEGQLAMKSGSMTGVLGFVGYKLDDDMNPTHAFCVLINNAPYKYSVLKKSVENWLLNNF